VTAVVVEPGFGAAFAAGAASVLSLCMAPLAPDYLAVTKDLFGLDDQSPAEKGPERAA
jgi:cytochrome c biogenesis protein CcdA